MVSAKVVKRDGQRERRAQTFQLFAMPSVSLISRHIVILNSKLNLSTCDVDTRSMSGRPNMAFASYLRHFWWLGYYCLNTFPLSS